MNFDTQRVWANVRQASTEDLLDRATVYQAEMEPEALDIIAAELRRRGVTAEAIEAHRQEQAARTTLPAGQPPPRCRYCDRAAVGRAWGWHWLWGLVPVFPRPYGYCPEHLPKRATH